MFLELPLLLAESKNSMTVPEKVEVGSTSIDPCKLGAESFRKRYNLKYAYLTGAMYKGIASSEVVIAMGKAGLMGFLGTAGLHLTEVEENIQRIQQQLPSSSNYGMNLIHSLDNPQSEMDSVELYIKYGITRIEAAAFMSVTKALVYYRVSGIFEDSEGVVDCKHNIMAKISRPEIAKVFLSPPPDHLVKELLESGKITQKQAELASGIALSADICVEADSAGHTDQGIATVLLPSIQSLRTEISKSYDYSHPIHVGLAGGIGTPQAALSAFMMEADFILTGSINQCTVEARISDTVKDLLQEINVQDTAYAPAGDMFELGAKVQVLKKGVFFPARANKLYDLYRQYNAWEEMPENTRKQIERQYFQKSFEQVWHEVKIYHQSKASGNFESITIKPKAKLALVFRWYFAYSTRIALAGDKANTVDFQVHTGPALGAFNQWVKGTELESWRNRSVVIIAEKVMRGAENLLTHQLRKYV